MMTTKSAKDQFKSIKEATIDRMDHVTTNQMIAGAAALGAVVGAAAIGAVVGAAATAIGSSLLHGTEPQRAAKAVKKPTA